MITVHAPSVNYCFLSFSKILQVERLRGVASPAPVHPGFEGLRMRCQLRGTTLPSALAKTSRRVVAWSAGSGKSDREWESVQDKGTEAGHGAGCGYGRRAGSDRGQGCSIRVRAIPLPVYFFTAAVKVRRWARQ